MVESEHPASEPLYDFPISNALRMKIDYKTEQPVKQAEPRRIFSFYIAAAR